MADRERRIDNRPTDEATQFQRLQELFEAAVDLAPDAQARFVDGACAADDAMGNRLRRMLACTWATEELVGQLAAAAHAVVDVDAEALPRAVGEFQVLSLLGRGGMGVVYEAAQREPSRRVALKVMRATLSPGAAARFARESEMLARLDHPNIAHVYAAGHTHDDQPYFAMERIDGQRLDDWIRSQPTLLTRIELLRKLCAAVEHAHQRGVIHRDLKPANVMVTAGGEPKIVDFGVARVADAELLRTQSRDLREVIGTLPYMSPEQLAGDATAIDTRADIYGLGVLAYEVLSGQLPFDLRGRSTAEVLATILNTAPTPLRAHSAALRGDLEAIVATAMAREPERRYASASLFGEDLVRYLRREPVSGRAHSRTYVLRRLLQRHRTLTTALAGVWCALTVGLLVSVHGQRTARLEAMAKSVALQRERGLRLCELAQRVAADNPGLAGACVMEAAEWAPEDSAASTAARVLDHLRECAMWAPPRAATRVTCLAVDAAGNDLAAGYADGTVRVFDVRRRELRVSFGGAAHAVSAVALHDGAIWIGLATGDLTRWRLDASPRPQGHLQLPGCVEQLVVAEPGVHALVDNRVFRIEATPTALAVAAREPTATLALTRDGRRALRRQSDGVVLIDRTNDQLVGRTTDAARFALSASGNDLAAADHHRGYVIAVADGTLSELPAPDHPIRTLAVDDRGCRVAVGLHDGTILVYRRGTQLALDFTGRGHRDVVNSLVFAADGELLCSGGLDGTVRIWRTTPCAPFADLDVAPTPPSRSPYRPFDGAGRRLAVVDAAGRATVRDAATGVELAVLAGNVRSLLWTTDDLVAGQTDAGDIVTWTASDGRLAQRLAHIAGPAGLAYDSARQRLAIASAGACTVVTLDGDAVRRLPGPGPCPHVEFSPTGDTLLLASLRRARDVECRLIAVDDQRPLASFHASTTDLRSPGFLGAWSPDGRRFATTLWQRGGLTADERQRRLAERQPGHARPTVCVVVDLDTGQRHMVELAGRDRGLRGAVFSPDGDTLCVSCAVPAQASGELLFVDCKTLQLRNAAACDPPPEAVLWSARGSVMTIGRDGSLTLRNARGRLHRRLPPVDVNPRGGVFDPTGSWLAVQSAGTLRVHTLDTVRLLRQSLYRDWLPDERAELGLD